MRSETLNYQEINIQSQFNVIWMQNAAIDLSESCISAKCNKIAWQTEEIKATLSYLVTIPV